MSHPERLANYLAGGWHASDAADACPVADPASAEVLGYVPLSSGRDVDEAVAAAQAAFPDWRATPVVERIQPLFRLKALLEERLDELAETITRECGKTRQESIGEIRRGIENVEVACGAPMLMQGRTSEDVARGIDEQLYLEPLGVVAAITPFNFPAMIPLWFLPYAVATGNCFVLKPSEKVPMTANLLFELLELAGVPAGVVSLVHGGRETVDALLDHPDVRAVSFVGSTPVARHVYARATARGKRAQCQGGAKNPAVVLPDADLDMATRILADSAFGCAGQRCLATSVVVGVGSAADDIAERLVEEAARRVVGSGRDADVEMGPVIDAPSRERVLDLVQAGVRDGAELLVGGRATTVPGFEDGSFVAPTVLRDLPPSSEVARTEIFGPVATVHAAPDLDAAIELVNDRPFGNQACLFTSSGPAARRFRRQARAGNVGVNLGVAAPMAFFPFSGWGESFFGDLHAQGRHAIAFYTDTKVVVERWPDTWARRF
jgi:malonate-semialdehyde dehydrogenase (acetylating)/methylmalonate-semialdehyde dehydrogenase